jgi:hypothetical protein
MAGTTIGITGAPWRATVTPWGAVEPWDGSPALDWWIGADDRWHVPADEPAVRQRRLEGTPVVETSVRVPSGDAVHRVYAVAASGGLTVIEVENRSPLPFAVAFSRGELLSARPASTVPVQGISLPDGAAVWPVAHRTTLRLALRHDNPQAGPLPGHLPAAAQVARGWFTQADRGVRLVLPDAPLAERVIAERCALLLEGPTPPDEDGPGFLLGVSELCRLGEAAAPWVEEVAAAAVAVAKSLRHRRPEWEHAAAFHAAAEVLARAGETRAVHDVGVMQARAGEPGPVPDEVPEGIRVVSWVLDALVRPTEGGADLLPRFPPSWLGQALEVYGAPVPAGTVSFAVRWHGERPALLWECSERMALTCSGLDASWKETAAKGEALLGVPPAASFS